MNILFIMYDQMRFDYMSCAGHPHLHTPNFDRVAARGVRFTNAYCQSPVCGPSRMSFYTGRYASSHGAAWNGYPLRAGEVTLGDHLRAAGMDCWLLGKTHMRADAAGLGERVHRAERLRRAVGRHKDQLAVHHAGKLGVGGAMGASAGSSLRPVAAVEQHHHPRRAA